MGNPIYYDINNRPSENEYADAIFSVIDGALSDVIDSGSATLNAATKFIGIGTAAQLPFVFTKDGDRWYVNGVEFAVQAIGETATSTTIQLAASYVAASVLGTYSLPIVASVLADEARDSIAAGYAGIADVDAACRQTVKGFWDGFSDISEYDPQLVDAMYQSDAIISAKKT